VHDTLQSSLLHPHTTDTASPPSTPHPFQGSRTRPRIVAASRSCPFVELGYLRSALIACGMDRLVCGPTNLLPPHQGAVLRGAVNGAHWACSCSLIMMSSQVAAAGEPTVEMSPALGNQGQGRGAEALVKEMAVVLSRDVPWETYSAAKLISGADLARIQVRRPLVAGCRGRRGGAVAKGVLRCTACVRACSCGLRGWPHAKHVGRLSLSRVRGRLSRLSVTAGVVHTCQAEWCVRGCGWEADWGTPTGAGYRRTTRRLWRRAARFWSRKARRTAARCSPWFVTSPRKTPCCMRSCSSTSCSRVRLPSPVARSLAFVVGRVTHPPAPVCGPPHARSQLLLSSAVRGPPLPLRKLRETRTPTRE
jgi:hypothetical protein